MFWLILMFVLLIFLLILLYLRVREDQRIKIARDEMPGKVVVITGASTLLGEALAQCFYSAGAKVCLIGPNQRELERVRNQLFSLRPKDIPVYQPEVVPMEINESEFSVEEHVADIMETCGQIDILINNSTICTRSDVLSTNIDDDIRVMNVNYFAPVAFTKAIIPGMIARQTGKVVFISSVAGKVPIPFRSSFAASKHALQAFSDTLRAEIAAHNIKVLVSNPEYIASDLTKAQIETAGTEKETLEENHSAQGDGPHKLANHVLNAVLRDDKEQIGIGFKFAYWLRVTAPWLFHLMMAERAKRMYATDKERF